MTEANEKVAERFFAEVLNEGRYEVASELYAPDFRNGTSTADEDVQAAKGWRDAFPDMRFAQSARPSRTSTASASTSSPSTHPRLIRYAPGALTTS